MLRKIVVVALGVVLMSVLLSSCAAGSASSRHNSRASGSKMY